MSKVYKDKSKVEKNPNIKSPVPCKLANEIYHKHTLSLPMFQTKCKTEKDEAWKKEATPKSNYQQYITSPTEISPAINEENFTETYLNEIHPLQTLEKKDSSGHLSTFFQPPEKSRNNQTKLIGSVAGPSSRGGTGRDFANSTASYYSKVQNKNIRHQNQNNLLNNKMRKAQK